MTSEPLETPDSGDEYVLAGYFRFVQSDEPGVVGKVFSHSAPGWAGDSDVPIYRKLGETKATLDERAGLTDD